MKVVKTDMEKGTQYMIIGALVLLGFFFMMAFTGSRPALGLTESSLLVGVVAVAAIGYIVTRPKSTSTKTKKK